MLASGLLGWFTNGHGMMALLTQNWLLGTLIIAVIVFCETGLVVMPFLPGDSLLFTTGALLGLTGIAPYVSILIITLAAILGDATNYSIGRSRLGQALMTRGWIKDAHLDKAQAYFDRFGGPTITLGRFVPIVRTVAPFVAGLTGMCPRRFLMFNVLGGTVWCSGLILAGYWLGQVSWIHDHLTLMSLGIVFLSLVPVLAHAGRNLHTEPV